MSAAPEARAASSRVDRKASSDKAPTGTELGQLREKVKDANSGNNPESYALARQLLQQRRSIEAQIKALEEEGEQ